jgi:ubiquinone/menaquinone biosynthesis C-methylase UbiE
MPPAIDALTAPTLKHVRELWWDDTFTEFLAETLRPRPGNRILDVGCGEGQAEVSIGRLQVSQMRLVGVDLVPAKAAAARRETASHNQRVRFAAGDACRLPFRDGAFDATFCVAVLQYVGDLDAAITEIARVTAPGGRIVIVEPDNAGRYVYSSVPAGVDAFHAAARYFSALMHARGEAADPSVGPRVPSLLASRAVEAMDVRMFPVSRVQLGTPPDDVWTRRITPVKETMVPSATASLRAARTEYLVALDDYRTAAREAGATFVEIQNTTLFATVGQKHAPGR